MTREQAKLILGDSATDEKITALLNEFHSEIGKKDEEIQSLNTKLNNSAKEITELTGFKQELQQIKESQMTAEQRNAELEKTWKAKISEATKLTNSVKAKSILVGAGISSERADELVGKIVKEDEQETLDLANAFVTELNSVREVTAKKIQDDLAKANVTPPASNVGETKPNDDTMTLEKFNSLSADEQNKFVEEHPEEFANL